MAVKKSKTKKSPSRHLSDFIEADKSGFTHHHALLFLLISGMFLLTIVYVKSLLGQ
ncbi:MAG: hypothetical protein WCO06_01235 [Candidatus Roizmanbacteria bacterium]